MNVPDASLIQGGGGDRHLKGKSGKAQMIVIDKCRTEA